MKNSEVIALLQKYPLDMIVKLNIGNNHVKLMHKENVLMTSDTSYIDDTGDPYLFDHEDGKVMLGDGERFLLINPIIT